MPSVSFTGLSSGIDSSSLISQLVTAEKRPAVLLQGQQSDLASQKSIVDKLSSQVAALGSLVGSMSLPGDVQYRSASASDAHVTVAASGDATATTHSVRVLGTAQAQVTSSRTFLTNDPGILGTGSLGIAVAGKTPATITWDSTDTLTTIASKINDAQAGVGASVLFDGTSYRLVVTADATGTTNAPTFTDGGDGLALSDPANIKLPPQDADLMIDGVEVKRPTNVISDAITGVTITAVSAQAQTDPDTQVTVAVDHDAIAKQLGKFVTDYNAIMTAINGQLTYTGTTAGTDTLFGDSTLRQLKTTLSSLASQSFGSMSLIDLGVTLDKTGTMSLDSTKLDTTLDTNPNAVSDLFVTGGLSQAVKSLTSSYTESGDGILYTKSQGLSDHSKALQDQIDQINNNATALQTRLEAQFTALEQTMSQLNSQSSYISKILTG